MFCPHCGAELIQGSTYCPQCGNPMSDDAAAAFASLAPGSPVRTSDMELTADPTVQISSQQDSPYAGAAHQGAVQNTMRQPIPSPDQRPYGTGQPDVPQGAPAKRGKAKPILIGLLLLALAVGGFFAWKNFTTPKEDPTFTLEITAEDLSEFDSSASPVPVRVKGTTESGEAIGSIYPVELSAETNTLELELPIGNYTVSPGGTPVRGDGTLFRATETSFEVASVISTGTGSDAGSDAPATDSATSDTRYAAKVTTPDGNVAKATFTYTPVPAAEISDADLSAVETWMNEAGVERAGDYLAKVRDARDAALSQQESERAAEEEARRQAEADEKAKRDAEKAAAEEEAARRTAAMEEALASNPSSLQLTEKDAGTKVLTFTGVLQKFEIPNGAADPSLTGKTAYYLKIPNDVSLTISLDKGATVTEVGDEIGVYIGTSADLEAHIGETVTVSGPFVYSADIAYPIPINIDGSEITTY